jgi:penicillin-binding protein 1C
MNINTKRRILHRHRKKNNGLLLRLLIGVVTLIFFAVTLLGIVGIGTVVGVYSYFTKDLPDPGRIETEQEEFETTKIYDRTGQVLLYEVFDPRLGDRTWVPIDQIPPYLRQATIAVEDKTFYDNPGFDIRGFARAFYYYTLRGGQVQGGSTITMQLIKNVLIPLEERYQVLYSRKIKEFILAMEISRRYSKDQILEWYLNSNFYGNLAYGVEAAAKVYFDKPVQELSLAECAMLAAVPQYPGLNPIDAPEQARKRQHLVLDAMMRQGYITAEEAVAAKYQKLDIKAREERFDIIAPHFSIYARKRLEEMFGPELVHRGGLRVYTTLDLEMQNLAQEIARERVAELQAEERNVSNAAVVVITPRTGEILVMLGSLDYWDDKIAGEVNVALANRQPGSSFKPFTYVTAFSQGYTAATMIMDVRTAFPDPPHPPYVPENYDRKYHGPKRIRQTLACSYNMPAVKVLDMAGVENVINTAHRMGINTLNEDYYGLSLTLGGGEITLLDMTYAFSVFANGGTMAGMPVTPSLSPPLGGMRGGGYRELDPVAILRVEDRDGNILWQYTTPETREVLSPQLAYLITDIMSDNNARAPAFGAESPLKLSRPAAVKTGTTDDFRDAWTIGYTPQIATGVWVGNSGNEAMEHVPGSQGAGPIWHNFMERVVEGMPVENFVRPPGFEEVEVCSVSGMLPTEHCPHKVKEMFIEGTAPTAYCNVHQVFRVNRETGKLATIYTPPELVDEVVYEIFPPEAADWVREQGIPQPPTPYDLAYGPSPATGDVAIVSPAPYAYLRETVPIVGNARAHNFQLYRLEYGQGINPSAWIQIGADHYNQVTNAPLEYWDVKGLDGLYTLQLSVVDGGGNYRKATIQVTVDNTPPEVGLIYPYDGRTYVMEYDEYVNISAEAVDNFSMDRVEFYLDDNLLSYSTIPPYNTKWTITMSDTIPIPGTVMHETQIVQNPDGSLTTQVITVTQVLTDSEGMRLQVFASGMTIISDTHGYTETHQIHVVAYDAAGNKAESEKVRIYVVHEREEEEQTTALWLGDQVGYFEDRERPLRIP